MRIRNGWLLVAIGMGVGSSACDRGEQATSGEASSDAESFDVPAAEVGTYLHLVLPSVIENGDSTTVRLRVVTHAGLPDYDFQGSLRLRTTSAEVEFPKIPQMAPTTDGVFEMSGIRFLANGVQRVEGSVPQDTIRAWANPVVVYDDPEYRIFWGDLNGQSDLSTGIRQPNLYFWYAKSVALLDFVALTDLDRAPSEERTLDVDGLRTAFDRARTLEEPGRFVAIPAFEWTSDSFGHRLVYLPDLPDTFAEIPSAASGVDTPEKLRGALPRGSLVAIAHPSGSEGAPAVDPASVAGANLVEMYSSRGTFEQSGSPRPSSLETPGAFVRDLLASGARPGFLGNSDSELMTPGNPLGVPTKRQPWMGGLTAVLAKELTREAVLEALRERRCYATTGPRYLMEFTVDGAPMGSELTVKSGHRAEAYGSLGSTTNWVRVDILGPDGAVASLNPDPTQGDVVELRATTEPITGPTYCYLRGVDEFGGMAWSSPVYLLPE